MSIIPSKKIPAEFFFDGIYDTEYGIPAEFRKNSVSTECGIPQYGIPYSVEFRKNIIQLEFRKNIIQQECPAQFRVTEFHRNFAEFFPGIPPELSYGISYFTEFRIYTEFRMLQNSVCYRIPYVTEFHKILNSALRNSIFYGIPQYGIPYSAELRKNTEFRNIQNSI